MEKRTPHGSLAVVRRLIAEGKVRSTYSAISGAAALDIDFEAMVGVVARLTMQDFYKSMTTHGDHRVWQDVYRPLTHAGQIYLKLTVTGDVLIVSFKEM